MIPPKAPKVPFQTLFARPITDLGLKPGAEKRLNARDIKTISDLVIALPTLHHQPGIGRETVTAVLGALSAIFIQPPGYDF